MYATLAGLRTKQKCINLVANSLNPFLFSLNEHSYSYKLYAVVAKFG